MSLSMQDLLRRPGLSSVYEELSVGRVPWDLVNPFPVQPTEDRAAGDDTVHEAVELVKKLVDPDVVDRTRALPDGLVETLRDRGFLKLPTGREFEGRGLSYLNVFRVVAAVASWSVPVALVLAVECGIGASAFEPMLPDGPLRDEIRARLRRGVISGGADTEQLGSANQRRLTTATRVENGAAYLISGEKVYSGNAPMAEWMSVSAALDGRTRMFFLDTGTPGFHVQSVHEFMGIKGFPNAALTFDRVRVPGEWMLAEDSLDRMTPAATHVAIRGRLFLIVAPALALARVSAQVAREFAVRRTVNERAVGEYEEVQRMLTDTLADVFAIETLAEWSLLGDRPDSRVNPIFEQVVAKNVASQACWRVVDRAMSLLAAEGFEVAASKAARGVPPLPMERLFRDARGLRISGGVDFLLDIWMGRYILSCSYLEGGGEAGPTPPPSADVDDRGLTPGNRVHLRALRAESAMFAEACAGLIGAHHDPEVLYARERIPLLVNQWLNELTTMTLVLARASGLATRGHDGAQDLADAYCRAAMLRVAGWRRELAEHAEHDDQPAVASVARDWLHGNRLDFLRRDLATDFGSSPPSTAIGERTA